MEHATPTSSWTVLQSPQAPQPRVRVLRAVAIGVVLAVIMAIATAYATSSNKAHAMTGHPDVLRHGCTWDRSGNYVQNCRVWSASQNQWVIVQIRASNGSNRGVYLLDGMRAREDRSAWTTDVQASQVYDGKSDTTLVMPVGGASSFYTDWNAGAGAANKTIKQETFLTKELPEYLSGEFGVNPGNNAIVGLSMSAGPAVTLAEKHPEQFRVVQAMSGYYQTDNPIGALGVFATQSLVSNYTNGIVNMWGVPGSGQWSDNDASKNLSKLKENGQTLVISSGNALPSPQDFARMAPKDQMSAVLLEAVAAVSTVLLQLQAHEQGVSVVSLPNFGVHNWANWGRGLAAGRDTIINTLKSAPPVPATKKILPVQAIGAQASASTLPSSVASSEQSSAPASSAPGSSSTAPSTSPSSSAASTSSPSSAPASPSIPARRTTTSPSAHSTTPTVAPAS